jgi:predicted negative regulator of RcsB-dependent stress response
LYHPFGADLPRSSNNPESLVNVYETDAEKVEALKKWWKENGLSVVAGVVIGLGAVFGWRFWVGYQASRGQAASAVFEQLMASAEAGDTDAARKQAEAIRAKYGSTAYAALASLVRARVELDAGNTAETRSALEQAIKEAPDHAVADIATLRLARVLVAGGDLAGARALLAEHDKGGSFRGDFAAVQGDIAAAQGQTADARKAYEEALAAGAADQELLQLKLENLPPAG